MKIFLLILFSSIVFTLHADEIVWDYDFDEPPDGWGYLGFVFQSGVALADHEGFWCPEDSNQDGTCACMVTELYTIPPSMDSLVLHLPQYVSLEAYELRDRTAYACVYLDCEINGSTSINLWSRTAYGFSASGKESLIDTLPIHVSLTDLDPGSFVSFKFWATHGAYNGYTAVYWQLEEAQLIAYGDLDLMNCTWGSIKTCLD